MTSNIAIIGSGPTGIYTLKGLIESEKPVAITIFESEAEPGKGTPYHPDINDRAMLSNIASIELPAICDSLTGWLRAQSDRSLELLGVDRLAIDERTFYPRIVLGEYFQSQFLQLVEAGLARGHSIDIRASHRVADIELHKDDIALTVQSGEGEVLHYLFDHVVLATGHDWPETTEIKPGYFISPWPAPVLKTIPPEKIGILGTSLSGIDALITVATKHGSFLLDEQGDLQYHPLPNTDGFHVTMMSRKGVLPEADFYCEIPYRPLKICTPDAVEELIASRKHGLLDALFELFRAELAESDPDYASDIGLSPLTIESIAPAYFRAREEADPFTWASRNLAEAVANKRNRYTVEWRYAILRMHEVIARAIPHLDEEDLKRFHKYFKTVFVDDYATVPHESIRRLLALHRAGRLDIMALGHDSEIDNDGVERGAVIRKDGETIAFSSFIDATGQHTLSARDIPFPTLKAQGVIRRATTTARGPLEGDGEATVRTGGVDLDDKFRPVFQDDLTNRLYCGSISFLLHKLPFVQGITSARDIGAIISQAILSQAPGPVILPQTAALIRE
ncbi:FAD/NAD(P)-binding protein [Rhizobium sp. SSA_523]|uniref:FAD/NAD(P)-binding protein n=1 Tax=Rhizobium sp. SSA_523 TaxID=2952477 RepID=UPI0020918A72|nr:FAD/NAD(P)-binding protein [Rhizobium sp. SSA_523]MCO5734192.1 FAD/NAD(P)-binding protein [Rhizobium sp. SSA_523]WKC21527.1 FAD/NAD(P)-binding protein [Rhizobium sp. SSA_523]